VQEIVILDIKLRSGGSDRTIIFMMDKRRRFYMWVDLPIRKKIRLRLLKILVDIRILRLDSTGSGKLLGRLNVCLRENPEVLQLFLRVDLVLRLRRTDFDARNLIFIKTVGAVNVMMGATQLVLVTKLGCS